MAGLYGYRGNAGGGYRIVKSKQEWPVGSMVSIGFVEGLKVLSHSEGIYKLRQVSTGRAYSFKPYAGLVREAI